MDDLIADFIVEARESLEVVDVELVRFEANPADRPALDRIFRLVHTLKGTCGFLGLARLEALAHAGETLLGRFRDGRIAVTPEAVTLVLRSIDGVKSIIDVLAATGAEPPGHDAELIAALETLSTSDETAPPATDMTPTVATAAEEAEPPRALRPGEVSLEDLEAAFQAAEAPTFDTEDSGPVGGPQPLPPPPEPGGVPDVATDTPPAAAQQSIRVGVEVLEGMMTLVSELVLTRNQLMQVNRTREDNAFTPPLQRLSSITGELQESVMKTRMQPIGQAWKKLPRLVRDLSNDLGKPIALTLDGEGTELDRQVLEQIRDPLTHMVRNSADHGLETPDERRAAGKPEVGQIALSAFHEGGMIVIRLRDDGRGLNTTRIREKAVEKGILTRTDAEALTDQQVHRLIFAPGFSTAAEVTSVSGRGVGMDVVRSNIEHIGGQIDLHSTPGAGCTITIKIPLTLAIISALIVEARSCRFAVPQTAVLELVKIGGQTEHRIELIQQVRMLRLREVLVPLIDLADEFGAGACEGHYALIMQMGNHRFGVLVDQVIDTEEVVVKPLAAALRHIDQFSGATILGDGSVVLIIDPHGLSSRAGEIREQVRTQDSEAESWAEAGADEAKVAALIVRAGDGAPKAVELSNVTRLEQVPTHAIEMVDGQPAIQYRGRLMPVLTVEGGGGLATAGTQPLLVFAGAVYLLGLAVDEIVDVVETTLTIELNSTRPGVAGTAVIAGRATEVIDVEHYMLRGLAATSRIGDSSAQTRAAA